jgi:pantoate--beta-alanine ligase
MVKIITTTQELQELRGKLKRAAGFVPTMGNLHAGHLSLLQQALQEYDEVFFSIFVNPKQFGPNEDFGKYPRTLTQDLELIQSVLAGRPDKAVYVFAPTDPSEIFPAGYDSSISVCGLSHWLEGKVRPGHFEGVATVVYRLFELIKPERAYFGLKDYQQYLVIRQMVRDLCLPVQIIGMPIIREAEGLALSSRNQYLSPEQRKQALVLFESLQKVAHTLNGKKANLDQARDMIRELIQDPNWDYLELRDAENLSPDLNTSQRVTLLGVYRMGTTRLLDNLQLELA